MSEEVVATAESSLVIDPSIVEEDVNQASTPEGQATEMPAGTTPQALTTSNWDAEDNPYKPFKARFDGLQGNFKQIKQRHDELAQLNSQLTEGIIRLQAQNEGLSPEETNKAITGYYAENELAVERQRLADERHQVATVAAVMGPFIVVQRASEQYKIDPEALTNELDGTESPREIDRIAKTMAKYRRAAILESRKETGVDNVGAGGGGSQDLSKMSSIDLMTAGFRELERQRR